MDYWDLAIERNRDALQTIVATLFALAGLTAGTAPATLPRRLRSFVLRVLRPAESAVRSPAHFPETIETRRVPPGNTPETAP